MAQLILSRGASAAARALAPQAFKTIAAQLARRGGAALGRRIDDALFGGERETVGPRLTELHIQGSSEGESIPLVYGRMRIAGQVIWAARFKEHATTARAGGGKSGGRKQTTFRYTISFAVGLCAGVAGGIGRVWANGAPLDLGRINWRFHPGSEDQAPDPLIEAVEGFDAAPAFRGLAYVVFEDLPLDDFGDAVPQLSFEVVRTPPRASAQLRLEGLLQGVCLIPGAGEFAYATDVVRRVIAPGEETTENAHARADRANILVSLDELQRAAPACRHVNLVVGWFGLDLRAGQCQIKPGVERRDKTTAPAIWRAGGLDRSNAHLVSLNGGAPAYGGSPSDESILQAIAELKARGFTVGIVPFVFMDIPSGDMRPNPDGGVGQPAYPWRGRIKPAAVDKTSAVATEVHTFFGACTPAHFSIVDNAVAYSGPAEWSYRRFVLHMAKLCTLAGGVDAFLIGSELRALTLSRDAPSSFPAVAQLRSLASDVRSILGAGAKLSYAADWSEYAGLRASDGSGDVYFHLDPLWADANIDAVAIDWYPPVTDWRDGATHLDAAIGSSPDDFDYLDGRIEGGEFFDWHYATPADRDAQVRTPISDGAYGEPWVFRAKDLRGFWANAHHDRPGGVRATTPTPWIAQSKPIWLSEYGAPAIDKSGNGPNVFLDPKSAESAAPPFSSGARDDVAQRRLLEALLRHWDDAGPNNPASASYGGRMIALTRSCAWAWDARPFPAFPARADVWADASAWSAGHWLNGRLGLGDLSDVVVDLCGQAGLTAVDAARLAGIVGGYVVDAPSTVKSALEPLMTAFSFSCVEHAGTVLFDHPPLGPGPLLIGDDLCAVPPPTITAPAIDESPLMARVRFIDPERDYRVSVAAARNPLASGLGVLTLEAPLALSSDQAEALGNAALRALSAKSITFAAPLTRLDLEPGDRIQVQADGIDGAFRIQSIEDRAVRTVVAVEDRFQRAPVRAIAPVAAPRQPVRPNPSLAFLDLPPLPGAEDDPRPLVGAALQPWRALNVLVGASAGLATMRGQVVDSAAIGVLDWPLHAGPTGRYDRGTRVRVRFAPSVALESALDADFLAGANAFAVRQTDGRWEIVQARSIDMVGPGVFDLSFLLRGLQGTEDCMGAPTPAGAMIVKLDTRLARLDLVAGDLSTPLSLFAVTPGGLAEEAVAPLPLSWSQTWARPFSPCHLRAVRQGNGDVALSWIRRTRVGGDSWSRYEAPLGEEIERYAVDILSGASAVRRVEVDQPTWAYSVALQIADFGAPPALLRWRVAQISTAYGPGARSESASPL